MALNNYSVEIDPVDLSEAPRLEKDSYSRATVIGVGCCIAVLAAMMIHGSLPELTPKEIVAMDGYVGEQPTRHIFNLQSFEDPVVEDQQPAEKGMVKPDEQMVAAVDTTAVANRETDLETEKEPAAVTASEQTQPVSTVVNSEVGAIAAPATESTDEVPEPIAEPIAEQAARQTAGQTASQITERTIVASSTVPDTGKPVLKELPTTVVKPTAAIAQPLPLKRNEYKETELVQDSTSGQVVTNQSGDSNRFLPLRRVLSDSASLRALPASGSQALLSLSTGMTVTVFEQQGDWVHVGVNDGSALTGYVLANELRDVE